MLPDPELITACLAGDAQAWHTLIERYAALIHSVAGRMGLSQTDAEDVFQEVCTLLLNHLGDLRDTSRLTSWIISTTRREVWRLRRRRGPALISEIEAESWQVETAQPVGTEAPSLPEETLLALEEQQLVREALQRLGSNCQQLLTLLYAEEPPCSYAEVAQRLNLPLGSIGPYRARCLQQLHKILEEIGF